MENKNKFIIFIFIKSKSIWIINKKTNNQTNTRKDFKTNNYQLSEDFHLLIISIFSSLFSLVSFYFFFLFFFRKISFCLVSFSSLSNSHRIRSEAFTHIWIQSYSPCCLLVVFFYFNSFKSYYLLTLLSLSFCIQI